MQQKKKKEMEGELFRNLSTFIAARCSGVSPLWFFFINAGLPEVGLPPDATGVHGDFSPAAVGRDGLSPGSPLEFSMLSSHLRLSEGRGLCTAGDVWDFLLFVLFPGEALGLFGVVSNVATFSSTLALLEEGFRGDASARLSGLLVVSDMLEPGWVGAPSTVMAPSKGLLPGPSSSVPPCGTLGWDSLDVTAGLRKETRLLDLLGSFAQGFCSFSFKASSSSLIPHCWFMASSLCFFSFCLVFLRVVLVAPCADPFPRTALFLVEPFFPFAFLDLGEPDEPESWEDEVKLKTDRSWH